MRKTKTSQIETAIADIFAVLNGKGSGMDKDSILEKMINKEHHPDVVHTALKEMNRFGGIIFTTDKKYFMPESLGMDTGNDPLQISGNVTNTKTPKQEEQTMKTETKTIDQVIENLQSGKKEQTLKKAKYDLFTLNVNVNKDIRTKQGMIDFLNKLANSGEYEAMTEEPVKESSSLVVDTIPEDETPEPVQEKQEPIKTRIAVKNHDRIAALQSCLDLLNTVLNTFDSNTLKQNKKSVSGILNTVSRKYLDDGIIFSITTLNKIAVKNEYKAHLKRETIPAITKGIEYENELQDKEPTKIDIADKAKMLAPDMAMMQEQHDIKEKSRFDCLYEMLKNQDKKIKELKDLVSCHKDTISILLQRMNTGNVKDTTTTKNPVKQDKKPVKTPEQLQAENRLAFIKSLKGIDKTVFENIPNTKSTVQDFLALEALEDFTPKQVKIALKNLVNAGLFTFTNDTYNLASIESFKGNAKNTKGNTKKQDKEPTKTKAKKTFTRGSSSKVSRNDAVQMAIASYNKGETFSIKDIAEGQNIIYADNGGKSSENPLNFCGNVTRKGIKQAISEGMVKDNGDKTYTVK